MRFVYAGPSIFLQGHSFREYRLPDVNRNSATVFISPGLFVPSIRSLIPSGAHRAFCMSTRIGVPERRHRKFFIDDGAPPARTNQRVHSFRIFGRDESLAGGHHAGVRAVRVGRKAVSFTAKVRVTGQLFWAAIDGETYRDAHRLEEGKRYSGHLFQSVVTEPNLVAYTEARWATFAAVELEDWPGDIRLIHVRA